MRRFDKLPKAVAFDDKQTCQKETSRLITDSEFNKTRPAVATIVLDTPEDIKKYIYPRIEHFHKNRKRGAPISKSNIYKDVYDKLKPKPVSIIDTNNIESTYNTINYMIDQFRQCIFVQILNNKIYTFARLNHYDESQSLEMGKYLNLDPSKYKNMDAFIKAVNATLPQHLHVVKKQEDCIYFANCAVRLWDTKSNSNYAIVDRHYTYFYHLLEELLKERRIGDAEFIFNSRDQNVLLEDGVSSPHYHIMGSFTARMRKQYAPFIPILNFNKHKRFADIPVPTNDDWEIITNKVFLGNCRDLYLNVQQHINRDYDKKIPTAIFRGGATGCGVVIKNNPRLKAAYLTSKYYNHPQYCSGNKVDGYQYLDARIVSFKTHPKKHYSNKYIDIIDPKTLPFKLGKKMTIGDISTYKYILSIEGNIAQFRLSLELSYNSVILLVKSDQYIWFQPLLQPWVHYVPIKSDLSDLMEKIHWCKTHDSKCKQIAANAYAFYQMYITKSGVFDYMEYALNDWAVQK